MNAMTARLFALVALVTFAGAGCGSSEKRTLLFLQLSAGPTAPAGVHAVDVTFTLGGQTANIRLADKNGAALTFPTGDVIEVASGTGQLDVVAVARDASDVELDRATGSATIVSGASTALTLVFGAASPSSDEGVGVPDLVAEQPDLLEPFDTDGGVRTIPDPPTNAVATAGLQNASVTWDEPLNNGGAPIVAYVVTSTPDTVQAIATAPTTSATVNGLRAGVSYTFTVRAANAVGLSLDSDPSNAVTPISNPTVPGAPTGVTAVATNGNNATVNWTGAPANGSAITSYELTTTPATAMTEVANVTTANISGLVAGTSYTVSVRARNALGLGPAGTSGAIVAGSVPVTPMLTSAAPIVSSAGVLRAQIAFTQPAGSVPAPSSWQAVGTSPTAATVMASNTASPITVTGLVLGASYTFTVRATNSIGQSAASNASTALVAGDVTSAPQNVSASSSGNGSATVSWTAPATNNGYPVTGYVVRTSTGIAATTVGATSAQFTNTLIAGSTYTFQVFATNAVGNSAAGQTSLQIPCLQLTHTYPQAGLTNVQYGSAGSIAAAPPLIADLSSTSDTTGWAIFKVNDIPTWARFDGLTLLADYATPSASPAAMVYFSADDSWTTGTATPVDVPRTAAVSGVIPLSGTGAKRLTITLGARNWLSEISNQFLTFGITNRGANPSTAQFSASASSPVLEIQTCE